MSQIDKQKVLGASKLVKDRGDIQDDIHAPEPFSFWSSEKVVPARGQQERKRPANDDNEDGKYLQKRKEELQWI